MRMQIGHRNRRRARHEEGNGEPGRYGIQERDRAWISSGMPSNNQGEVCREKGIDNGPCCWEPRLGMVEITASLTLSTIPVGDKALGATEGHLVKSSLACTTDWSSSSSSTSRRAWRYTGPFTSLVALCYLVRIERGTLHGCYTYNCMARITTLATFLPLSIWAVCRMY